MLNSTWRLDTSPLYILQQLHNHIKFTYLFFIQIKLLYYVKEQFLENLIDCTIS